jgi:hypothetical protein
MVRSLYVMAFISATAIPFSGFPPNYICKDLHWGAETCNCSATIPFNFYNTLFLLALLSIGDLA